jgi:outer membrane receptor for ferric coprogen and ferric-rhodotorulic acid
MTILEKKNIWGKLKLDYQPTQYWKNKFNKDNFFKKIYGETLQQNKNYVGETP